MKRIHRPGYLLLLSIILASCASIPQGSTPTADPTPIRVISTSTWTPTRVPPTPTKTPQPLPRFTLTPLPTWEATQASDNLVKLLRGSNGCAAPCFMGITPGETTSGEALNILYQTGLQVHNTGAHYEINYEYDEKVTLSVILRAQGNLIQNTTLYITYHVAAADAIDEWAAFSPAGIVKRYGPPDRLMLRAGVGPSPSFDMVLYYDENGLILDYPAYKIIQRTEDGKRVCPIPGYLTGVYIWMGDNPEDPPAEGVALEDVTTLTMDDFVTLMTGDPQDACFIVTDDVFIN